ncbi:MAG: hypothetical protein R6V54_07170 [Desulfobacteraceae bacterium]
MPRFQENDKCFREIVTTTYRVDDLKAIAGHLGKKYPTRKAELVNHIVETLFANLDSIVAGLTPDEKRVLSETVHTWQGEFRVDQLKAKYGDSVLDCARSPRGKMPKLGLFIVKGEIAPDLLEKLEKIVKKPEPEKITYCDLPETGELMVRTTDHDACINLNTLLTMVQKKEIRVSKTTGRPTAAQVKKISSLLKNGDFFDDDEIGPVQAFAWPLLLQGGGLASIEGTQLKLTKKGTAALKKDLSQGIKAIFTRWEKTKIIDEFSRVKAVKGQKSAKGRTMTSPVRRRPVINEALACLEPGRWVTVDELSRFMLSESYTFEMCNNAFKLYFGDPNYGHLDYYDVWPLLNLRYLLIYCLEYLATLGLMDVAYQHPEDARNDYQSCWGADDKPFLSHCDGLRYIRLNDLGAYVLDISSVYRPGDDNGFQLDGANIVYTGKGDPSPDQRIFLDSFAQPQEKGTWQITIPSLLNAVKAGKSVKEIKSFVKTVTSEKPGKVLDSLFKKVEATSESIVDRGKATLLECSPRLQKQILADKQLKSLCLPAGNRHIAVLPEKEALFTKHLEALGFIIGS